ncbi:MAG TPA: hypothetical protein HPP77_01140 [Candidatus Hydrogenedentes bacterium]|nr:hypothetical protein [Candidatus Hydrogenedentota bacterium]
MTRKTKHLIRRSDDLETIDSELETAMRTLDGTNQKVEGLLNSLEGPAPEAEESPDADLTAPASPDETAEGLDVSPA